MGLGSKLLEVATQLGTSSEFVYENREAWSVRRLLRRAKCDPAKLTASDVREANSLERRQVNAMYDRWADEEKGGEDRLVSVVHGHPTLDPQLNPDHPFNRRARGKPQRAEPVSPGEKKMPKFVVSLKQGQRLLKELGHQHTDKLNAAAILTALKRVDDTADDAAQAKVTDPASQDLLKKLLVALAKGDDITIATAAPVEKNGSDKPKAKTEPEDDDDEEGEEDEDEDADSDDEGDGEDDKPAAKKPASKPETDKPRGPVKDPPRKAPSKPQERTEKKPSPAAPQKSPRSSGAKPGAVATKPKQPGTKPKQPGTKAVSSLLDIGDEKPKKKPASKDKPKTVGKKLPRNGKGGRPGVYAVIVEALKGASKAKPIKEVGLMAALKKQCKDRSSDSMLVTLRDAIRRTLKARYGLKVQGDEKTGYWLD